jgi:hypothetical protein
MAEVSGLVATSPPAPPRFYGDSIDPVHGHTLKYENIIYGYIINASEMKMIVT